MDFIKLRNFQLLLIGLLMLINVCRGGHFLQLSSDEYHCGRQLAEFLENLCQGNINTLGKTKKSGFIDYINEDAATADDLVGTEIEGSYIQSQPGRLYTRVRRYGLDNKDYVAPPKTDLTDDIQPSENTRLKRALILGITNKCCSEPCTISYIRSFCK